MSSPISDLFLNLSLKELAEKHHDISQNSPIGDHETSETEELEDPKESQELATEFSFQKNSENNKKFNLLERGKIFDINLENPVEGWNIPSFIQTNEINGEQIFTRAPNFRTGHKAREEAPRNLSEGEIAEEVKSMYKSVRFEEQVVQFGSGNKVGEGTTRGELSRGEVSTGGQAPRRKQAGKRRGRRSQEKVEKVEKIEEDKIEEVKEEEVKKAPYSTQVIRGMKRTKPKPPQTVEPTYVPSAALEELRSIWRQIQQQQMKISDIEDLGSVDEKPEPPPNFQDFDADLQNLLKEAEISTTDFEQIVNDLNIPELSVGAGIDDLLSEIVDPDAKEETQISHWSKSGASEYVEKYHEEKFRRQTCEEEINKLQKEILTLKQDKTVLLGNTKRKEETIFKIIQSWKELSRSWINYQVNTTLELEKLKKEQAKLIKECEENREKLKQFIK